MSAERILYPFPDARRLETSLTDRRTLVGFCLSLLVGCLTLAALVPLFSVMCMLVIRGGKRLGLEVLTELPPLPMQAGGGFGNALAGTVVMTGIAAMLAVPAGVLAALFLAETAPDSRLAHAVRFSARILAGFPAILAGVFAYGTVVLLTGRFSAAAGGVALSLLMLPVVMLTAEAALRTIPRKMKEAAIGMGATDFQYVWMVLLPAAAPGMLTGVMLAVARAAGETAPLLFTALFSNYWPWAGGDIELMQPTASLAVLVYNFSGVPFKNQVDLAWAAALVLVLLVLTVKLIGQALSGRRIDQPGARNNP